MISLKNVGISFDGVPAVEGFNLEVGQGESVSVIGSNGSGKTSLCLFIAGVIPEFIPAEVFGKLNCSKGVGVVMQNPSSQFLALGVEEELGNIGIAKKLGLGHLLGRSVFDLSEGEKQKVNLAANIFHSKGALLLDEPLELLDPVEAGRFLDILRKFKGRATVWFDKDLRFAHGSRRVFLNRVSKPSFPKGRRPKLGQKVLDASFSMERSGFSLYCLDFTLRDSEKVGIIGLNGSGKTTFLRALAGVEKISGKVMAKKGFSIAPQNPSNLFFQETVEAELMNKSNAFALGISGFLDRDPGSLSKGQQKLVSVAAIAPKSIALLDEPTTWLDNRNKSAVYNFINSARQPMVISTHDKELLRFCDRIFLIENGGLSECSSTQVNRFFLAGLSS